MNRPNVASAGNIIKYTCGCLAEFQLVGTFAHIPEYHIIPCYEHTENRKQIEEWAEEDWERLTSEHPRPISKEEIHR